MRICAARSVLHTATSVTVCFGGRSVWVQVAGDLVEVGVPCSAATAPDVYVRILLRDSTHAPAEVDRVAGLKVPERAQRDLVHHGSVRSQTPDSLEPVAWLDGGQELDWVRAVDPVEGWPLLATLGVDRLDGLTQARTGVQSVIAVEGERDRCGEPDPRSRTGHADRFRNIVERHCRDEVYIGCRQGPNLG